MENLRTSESHPLQVPMLDSPAGGRVGLTFCPGKCQRHSVSGGWARDLSADLQRIRDLGTKILVSLVELQELEKLNVSKLGAKAQSFGMSWLHLPIPDMGVPSIKWEQEWLRARLSIHEALDEGDTVVVHCKGGLGRAGTIAARLLVERGEAPHSAISRVRKCRPGAIETKEQEAHVMQVKARSGRTVGL